MRFFPTKRTLYSDEDIEIIKKLVEIFINNLDKIITIDLIKSIQSRSIPTISGWNKEKLLDIITQLDVNLAHETDFIDLLPTAFSDIFTLYCLDINFKISKTSCEIVAKNYMFTGERIIITTLFENDFFKVSIEEKMNLIRSLMRKSEKGEIPSCPFHHVDNGLKDNFFNKVWSFIDLEFFPTLFQKFGTKPQLDKFIQLANQGDEKGKIALFHLGLLGVYERGEL